MAERTDGRTASFEEVFAPISPELSLLEGELERVFTSDIGLISEIGRHLVSMKGKRVRPTLLLLASRLGKPETEAAVRAAVAVEVIHTATLLHDDSIDRSPLRRGLPTINRLWNDQVSVIMGDHLFCTAFRLLHEKGLHRIASVLAAGSDSMTFGEMYQMDLRGKYDLTEETYLDMIRHKTASLFSSACEAGAILGELSPDRCRLLRDYGELLGTAFQIVDDILDFVGEVDFLGKPIGNDLRDGRATLPLIVALRNADQEEAEDLRRALPDLDGDRRAWRGIVDFIRRNGGLEYSRLLAHSYSRRARGLVESLSPSPAARSLALLADGVVSRKK
jgi:octaprenyl-diphosphate synthase